MTVRGGFGHAVKANGWLYWLGLMRWWFKRMVHFRRPIALIRALTVVISKGYYGELCQICGRRYVLWWAYEPGLFDQVTGPTGEGLMCPTCFDRAAAKAGIELQWVPRRFPVDAPLVSGVGGVL